MSAIDEKKHVMEQSHFRAFCLQLSEFSADEALREKPPAPDFLIKRPSGDLGVELTTLSSDRRELEERRNMTVQAGQCIYQKDGNPHVLVATYWHGDSFPKGVSTRFLGEKLAKLVELKVKNIEGDSVDLEWLELKEVGLEKVFDKIHIKLDPRGVGSIWYIPDAASMNPTSSGFELVKKLVSEKERKISEYRKACAEVWLVLVAEGNSISRIFDVESLSTMVLETNFDRIYLLDLFYSGDYTSLPSVERESLFRLQLRRPTFRGPSNL